MATKPVVSRIPTPADHALCACGCPRSSHHLETGCKPGDKCGCRPCTGRHDCSCAGFVSPELAYQRRLDAADRAREFAADGGW